MADVIIIGAGVIGLMTARELLAAGLEVRLFDRGNAARESSWAGGGILSPLYPWRAETAVVDLFLESRRLYPDLIGGLTAATGIDPEWLPSGLLVTDGEDSELIAAWCRRHRLQCRFPTAAEFAQLEPGIAQPPKSPVFLPEIFQVRNPRLLRALRTDVEARGGCIIENRAIVSISVADNRIAAVATTEGSETADRYIVATGAWSGLFSRPVLPDLPVTPVKGQMIVLTTEPGTVRHIVLDGGRYLIPRKDGRVVVGSTVEQSGFDKSTSAAARDELAEFARTLMPALEDCPIENHWAGLRPGSPGGIPFIGPHPEIENLYFNCGHYRNGFVMAPASAGLLADLMLERPISVDARAYAIDAQRR